MADFCLDCTIELFGKNYAEKNDFRGIISKEVVDDGYLASVLCEGCGFIMVDNLGKRISTADEWVENTTNTKIPRPDNN
jgi:hypothetical protein